MGTWAVLTGDSVHCFGDGVLIASAFMADVRLGVIASLAVLAHEVPHHMGDLMVLRRGSANKRAALVKVSLAGAVTAIGGLKEKLLAALRGGIKTVFIPEENEKDLAEIPDNVKLGLKIIPVTHVREVLAQALVRQPEPVEWDEAAEEAAAAARALSSAAPAQTAH